MISKKNLALLGMMGVGKTSVGKLLSKKLNLDFFDIDHIIEKENKLKIKEIFDRKGEEYFRKKEEITSLNYLKKNNCVISLGGGAFVSKNIREKVLLKAESFWLTTSIKILKSRLKLNTKRPLLNNIGINNIEKLVKERNEFYKLANHKIECEKLTLNEISNIIITLNENKKN